MRRISTMTSSRYQGAKVFEYADAGGNFYKVELSGILLPKRFVWLSDAWDCIRDHRMHQLHVMSPIH